MKAITDKTKANRITKHIRQATHRSGFKYNVNDGYMMFKIDAEEMMYLGACVLFVAYCWVLVLSSYAQ